MRKFLLTISLLISSLIFSQDTSISGMKKTGTFSSSTINALRNAQRTLDSLKNDATYGQMERNMNDLLHYQQEQKEKQRKKAMWYIGIGLFFLIVLVIGLRRKAKKE